MNDLSQQIHAVQGRIAALRQQKPGAVAAANEARDAYDPEAKNARAQFDRARQARRAASEIDEEIAALSQEEQELLGQLADHEAGMPATTQSRLGVAGNGWVAAAKQLDLQRGENRVDLSLASLMRAQLPGTAPTPTGRPTPAQSPPDDRRYVYPALQRSDVAAGQFSVTDFTVSFGQTPVSGIERDVDAITPKSELDATVGLGTPQLRQFAVVLDSVPVRVFETQETLQALLKYRDATAARSGPGRGHGGGDPRCDATERPGRNRPDRPDS